MARPLTPAGSLLVEWLVDYCKGKSKDDARDAVRAVEDAATKAMAARINRRLPHARHYHNPTLRDNDVLTFAVVQKIVKEEDGE